MPQILMEATTERAHIPENARGPSKLNRSEFPSIKNIPEELSSEFGTISP